MEFEPKPAHSLALKIGVGMLAVGAAAGLAWRQRERLAGLVQRLPHHEAIGRYARMAYGATLQPLFDKLHDSSDASSPAVAEAETPKGKLPIIAMVFKQNVREYQTQPHDIPFGDNKLSIGIFRDIATSVAQTAADTAREALDRHKEEFFGVDEDQGQQIVAQAVREAQQAALEAKHAGSYTPATNDDAVAAVVTRLFQNNRGETYVAVASSGQAIAELVEKNPGDKPMTSKVRFTNITANGISTGIAYVHPGDQLINSFANVMSIVHEDKIEGFADGQTPDELAKKIVDSAEKADVKVTDTPGRVQDKTVAILWYIANN